MKYLPNLGFGLARRLGLRQPGVVLPDRPASSPSRYLSIVAMFKDEARYLAEWLEFHRLVGVEHVFLYDNGSTDNPETVLAPFVESGFATVFPWAAPWPPFGEISAQTNAYAHAILNFGSRWRWMVFLDLDEFLFPLEGQSLAEVMREYEDLPAVAVFWTMFGTSGIRKRPSGLVIENYTMRAPFPTHAKSKCFVDPSEVVGVAGAHLFNLRSGTRRAFTETRELFEKREGFFGKKAVGQPVEGKLRLNHYYTRSRGDLDDKLGKRQAAGRTDRPKLRKIAELLENESQHDDAVLRFLPELKARLKVANSSDRGRSENTRPTSN